MKLLVHFLPARYGDSIWVEYGEDDDLHHILIDGGTAGTATAIEKLIGELPVGKKHLDLVVITHIDQDHIAGILKLLSADDLNFTIGDLWFNGWDHLNSDGNIEAFGAKQGERLSAAIIKHKLSWNKAFDNGPVVISDIYNLPVRIFPGNMKLTLLSPLTADLLKLRPVWVAEIVKANLVPGYGTDKDDDSQPGEVEVFGATTPDIEGLSRQSFTEDDGEANASSIAFLAQYGGKNILFTGDALPGKILVRLQSIQPEGKLNIDLFKISHHASAGNTSPEILKKLNCKLHAISTSGASYYHPAPATIARIIKIGGPKAKLVFN